MKLIGNPKEKEEGARTEEEGKRELVEKAKMKLDGTELEQVAGGASFEKVEKRDPEGGFILYYQSRHRAVKK